MTMPEKTGQDELPALRDNINAVDAQILALLHQRAALSRRVGECKRRNSTAHGPIYRPERERQVLETLAHESARLAAETGTTLPREHIERIWREIFSSSRALQEPLKVAFLGPEGTFSHMAAQECLGHSVEARPVENFYAVFRAVQNGECDMGLVPLENSLHGTVGQNFDLFAEHAVHIVGEHYSRIQHCLMSQEEDIHAVRHIYSHPQALGQCAAWLRAHAPQAFPRAEESTAAAARRALDEAGSAAIAHPNLAAMLGLHVLASNVEDTADNWTRFALIAAGRINEHDGQNSASQNTADTTLKSSLLFTVPDKPGSLACVLALLDKGGINMSKLESRPMRGAAWQYVFFADVTCDLLRPEHADVRAQLKTLCQSVRVLGVYASQNMTDAHDANPAPRCKEPRK